MLLFCNIIKATEKDSIAVYLFMLESCPISQQVTPAVNQIYREFKGRGVSFQLIFPNADYTTPETLHSFLKKYQLEIPAVIDSSKSITNKWGATVTPEVVVVKKSTGAILYRGRIDNSYVSLGKKRSVVNEHYLKDALWQIVANKTIAIPQTEPVGCFIMKP